MPPPHPQQQQQAPPLPPTTVTTTPQPPHQPSSNQPPPNIGPGSNYFGGIMNAHGNPGLVAPPQMQEQQQQQQHYPSSSSQPPSATVPPPASSSVQPPSQQGYINGSNQPPQPPPQQQQASPYGQSPSRGMPTPPTSAHPQQREREWNGYNNVGYNNNSRPSSAQESPNNNNKRKSGSSTSSQQQMIPARPIPAVTAPQQQAKTSPSVSAALADVDPESVPANLKVEGQDWFALFNPKTSRQLKVDLVHTLDHASVVCCVKFSADGRYLAAGCNRATFIYDVATSQRVA
jgi:glucose repression regulatory protein TUP1